MDAIKTFIMDNWADIVAFFDKLYEMVKNIVS